jgi:hypothetical protein
VRDERVEVVEKGGRRGKLIHDVKKTRGYWKSEEEELGRTLWRTRFGRGCGPVLRQTAE